MSYPRPAPPGQMSIWERDVEGMGRFYTHGPVDREGVKTYLVRCSSPSFNGRAICLLGTDGEVIRWYSDWMSKSGELSDVLRELKEFVIAHVVMTS